MMLQLVMVLLLATSGSASIGFYPDIATALVKLPDVYIKVSEWKHTYVLSPPCHDSTALLGHIKVTRDSVNKLRGALSTPFVNMGGTVKITLRDRMANAETQWGWSSTSLCDHTNTVKRTKRETGMGDSDNFDFLESKPAGYQSRPSFYGASIGQVFVQTDARKADNSYMESGSNTNMNDAFGASIREQELLKVMHTRRFYNKMNNEHLHGQYKATSNVEAQSRGDNLPDLKFTLSDQDGNVYYEARARARTNYANHISNVNFNMHDRMSKTSFRPASNTIDSQLRVRRRRGLDFIGEFYHWFAGIATDSQIKDVLELMKVLGKQLNTTSQFVETNARTIQSLSQETAEEFKSLASVITDTQSALKQSTQVMNENFSVLESSLANVTKAAELTRAVLLTLIELTECNAKASLLESSLLTSAEFYVYVSDAMVSGTLPLALVHTSQVVETMKKIATKLPERLALPPAILFEDMLSHIPIKVGVQQGKVVLIMTVLIIKKPRQYLTSKLVTHPIFISGYWYKARIQYPVYITDLTTGEWLGMSQENYQLCSTAA